MLSTTPIQEVPLRSSSQDGCAHLLALFLFAEFRDDGLHVLRLGCAQAINKAQRIARPAGEVRRRRVRIERPCHDGPALVGAPRAMIGTCLLVQKLSKASQS